MGVVALTIRPAERGDIHLLADFALAMAWETEHKRLDRATVERGVAAVLAQPQRGVYRVAERDGKVVGALMITYEWSDWRCADWWWIQSVYITPEARRSGVFKALYRSVQQEALQRSDVCGIRLYVERDNHRAQATYAAIGMQDAAYRVMEETMPWVAELIKKE
ncbi:GNAT family N-acetyltransferase [Pseudomarimonas arenosa]|uniref:GNAT family N-acetyltransferase n=1 Tax=Pseudomarimonas arenosa TaxID=2774145 RepID=A0AAW3ZV90_9GAMM|nr:GNAT family N-acetyltransferase [Pseudomarimonas arenosa]MBD8527966.1 GNAT family N-acetyltransferase [Pseudomarimonas arenosa]